MENNWEIAIMTKLITKMTATSAKARPSTREVLLNPFFWDDGKIRSFLETSNDFIQKIQFDKRYQTVISNFKDTKLFGEDWLKLLDWEIKHNLLSFPTKYDPKCNISLLKGARNAVSFKSLTIN